MKYSKNPHIEPPDFIPPLFNQTKSAAPPAARVLLAVVVGAALVVGEGACIADHPERLPPCTVGVPLPLVDSAGALGWAGPFAEVHL